MIFPKQNVILDHLYLKVRSSTDELGIEHGDLRIGIVDSNNVFEKWVDLNNCIGPWYDCVVEPIIYYFTRSDQSENMHSNLLAEAMYGFIMSMYNVLRYNKMEQYSIHTLNELRNSVRKYNYNYPVAYMIEKALIDKINQLIGKTLENTDGVAQDNLSIAFGIKNCHNKEFVVHDAYWNNVHVYKFSVNSACWIDFIQPLGFVLCHKKKVSVGAVEAFINLAKAYDTSRVDEVNPFEAKIKDDAPYAIQTRELIGEVAKEVERLKAQE